MTEKSCAQCTHRLLQDTGYSNWTVMGTDFSCLLNAHPAGTFDLGYELPKELKYAEQCTAFEVGDGIQLDVDGETEVSDADKARIAKYEELRSVIRVLES